MVINELKPGMKVLISNINNKENVYSTKVVDIVENHITILGPMKYGRDILLRKGTKMSLTYNVENKGNFFFECEVEEISKDKIYLVKLKKTSKEFSNQARNNFRVESRVPIKIITNNGKDLEYELSETKNLSAGGARIFSNIFFEKDENLKIILELNSGKIVTDAIIVRKLKSENLKYKYSYAISFQNMSEQDEDFIVKYLFDFQRLMSAEGRYK